MIRRGVLIAGGLLVALSVALVAWPSVLTQASMAAQRALAALMPSSGPTLPSVINVHAPSTSGHFPSPLVGESPSPAPVPSPAPTYPAVVSPPIYSYPAPTPPAEGGGDRHGGKPSPSPGGHR